MRWYLVLALLLSGCVSKKLHSYINESEYDFRDVQVRKGAQDIDLCFRLESRKDASIKTVKFQIPNKIGAAIGKNQNAVLADGPCGNAYADVESFFIPSINREEVCLQQTGVFGKAWHDSGVTVLACVPDGDGRRRMQEIYVGYPLLDSKVGSGYKVFLNLLYPVTVTADVVIVATVVVIVFPEVLGHKAGERYRPALGVIGRELRSGAVAAPVWSKEAVVASEPAQAR